MKLFITAKPSSKKESVEKIDSAHFVVRVKAPAREGKGNKAVIRALAGYFDVAQSQIEIVSGIASRKKTVRLNVRA
ncbi:MAG: DUF167 domain-containing protein [Candidatus Jacksonbacteria bacterium]|nr:DUF167 domain-containing protein [Candidatus Jacksonbacteria bacterium]